MDIAVTRRFQFALALVMVLADGQPASAASPASAPAANCHAHASEASLRSGIAVDVIMRVMRVESAGSARVISPKGAIGCMQIMPRTWAYLSARYNLGRDPYDARMNMIGGALYLAELARRFGWPGAYAAYNAGPSRYFRYATNGTGLPAETVAYASRLGGAAVPVIAAVPQGRWQEARLFLDRAGETGNAVRLHAHQPTTTMDQTGALSTSGAVPFAPRMVATLFPIATGAQLPER